MLSLSVLRLGSDRSQESTAIASHQPATLCTACIPTVFVTVVVVIFKFAYILAQQITKVKGFYNFFIVFCSICALFFFVHHTALHFTIASVTSLSTSAPVWLYASMDISTNPFFGFRFTRLVTVAFPHKTSSA